MIRPGGWSYVQARLQARHGERLEESDWRMLESTKAFVHFIERSRSTSLRRFTDHMNAQMTSHLVERVLRNAWRGYVAEVAAWMAPAWKPVVLWIAHVPDLPLIDRLLNGETPDWARDDPVFAPLADPDLEFRVARLKQSPLAPLSPARDSSDLIAERWLNHWRLLWPRRGGSDARWLDGLVITMKDHFALLARASAQETSSLYRSDLAYALTRMFRRHSATPVAVVCHLALLTLDLERLRGGLVRRRMFDTNHSGTTA